MTTEAKDTLAGLPRRALLASAAALIGLAGTPGAEAAQPGLVDLQVIDRETRAVARIWRQAGRTYVAGRPGARYGVRVTNTSPGRVLAVVSVDGVNVVTGETADYGQRGYVLEPYQSYEVNGWRKSDTEVAAFTFDAQSRSYAARTGRPGDVGVIGVAAFTERPALREAEAESAARARPRSAAPPVDLPAPPAPPSLGIPAAPAAEKLGTGHGPRERSSVVRVTFERATPYPQIVKRIEYDSFENLVASGVIPRPRATPARPRPFPGAEGYAPDPPDWR